MFLKNSRMSCVYWNYNMSLTGSEMNSNATNQTYGFESFWKYLKDLRGSTIYMHAVHRRYAYMWETVGRLMYWHISNERICTKENNNNSFVYVEVESPKYNIQKSCNCILSLQRRNDKIWNYEKKHTHHKGGVVFTLKLETTKWANFGRFL